MSAEPSVAGFGADGWGARLRSMRALGMRGGGEPSVGQMRAEDGEAIGMADRDDRFDIGRRRSPLAHLPAGSGGTGVALTGTPQISAAYSRMARSEENQPTPAVFRMAVRHQAGGWRHRASISRWAA